MQDSRKGPYVLWFAAALGFSALRLSSQPAPAASPAGSEPHARQVVLHTAPAPQGARSLAELAASSGPLFFIEAEDFNYDGGRSNPKRGVTGSDVDAMPYVGGAYAGLGAIEGVDYNNNDGNESDQYRTERDAAGENEVNIAPDLGGPPGNGAGATIPVRAIDRGTYTMTANYKIGWAEAGSWQNYTRVLPAGWYTARLASSYGGTGPNDIAASLDRVTSDPAKPNQTTVPLGQFNAPGSGGWSLNNLVPLRTPAGQRAAFKLPGGPVTLRLNLGSGDVDFFLLEPSAPPPPIITTIPEDDVKRDAIALSWTVVDSETRLAPESVQLRIDGVAVPGAKVTVTKSAAGATIALNDPGALYAAGEHRWELSFSDDGAPAQTATGAGTFIVNPLPTPGTFVIEAEDFNYDRGQSNPQRGVPNLDVDVMPYLGGAYAGLGAFAGIDYHGDDSNDADEYRTERDARGENAVNISASNGTRFGNDRGIYATTANWRIGWVLAGEWHNYTRNLPSAIYHVWAGLSSDGRAAGQLSAALDRVISDPAQPNQAVERLGSFLAAGSGGWGRNKLVPMRDNSGRIAAVTLGGRTTLRFYPANGDFDYFLLVPANDGQPLISGAALHNGRVTVHWTGGGVLESAPQVQGPWSSTGRSDGWHTVALGTTQQFFRVRH